MALNPLAVRLARIMTVSTLASAALIAAGLVWYLSAHIGANPGDHLFSGEPVFFRYPLEMLRRAADFHADGERRSIAMIGIFVLLLSPLLRVFLAAAGFLAEGDRLYAAISAVVFAVLVFSFFW